MASVPSAAADGHASSKRLKQLLLRFKDTRLLVVGDLMLDQFIRGSVSRISPEAPVPVVQVRQEQFIPGGAGNVVHNLAALGAKLDVVGVIGQDAPGAQLKDYLALHGVSAESIITDGWRVTSQKCRVIAEHQQVVRFDRETKGPLSGTSEAAVLRRIEAALPSAQAVILSDYGKGVLSKRVIAATISAARRRRIPVTVDPKPEHFSQYKGVTCITPNLAEARAGLRRDHHCGHDDVDALGGDILRLLHSRSVLITRGAEGMSLYEKGGRTTHIPTLAREVFDVTGAGDTVISVLTLALACGASLRDAALLSNVAAGIVVGKLGTAAVDLAELKAALR